GGPGGGQVCGEALQVGEGGGGEGPFDAAFVFGGVERAVAQRVAEALDGGVAVVVGGACPVVCVGHDRFPWAVPGSGVARCGGGVRPSGWGAGCTSFAGRAGSSAGGGWCPAEGRGWRWPPGGSGGVRG